MDRRSFLTGLGAGTLLSGCAAGTGQAPAPGSPAEVARLEAAILALGPGVAPVEARDAAAIAYAQTHRLALEYEIVDPPLIHNTKVNMGIKPRGLCNHWAQDMEARLAREDFGTLELHRAIANFDHPFRIEHSTVIVSRRGDGMRDGIVLDPWRLGGTLTWVRTDEDPDYVWLPRQQVFDEKIRRLRAEGRWPGGA